ncbi:MAG: hypothetical protein JJU20_02305 [Opitutales bacterium]|nr:hypothetical protein [Opitutales bacterium]
MFYLLQVGILGYPYTGITPYVSGYIYMNQESSSRQMPFLQVAFVVPDLEQAVAFYAKELDLNRSEESATMAPDCQKSVVLISDLLRIELLAEEAMDGVPLGLYKLDPEASAVLPESSSDDSETAANKPRLDQAKKNELLRKLKKLGSF